MEINGDSNLPLRVNRSESRGCCVSCYYLILSRQSFNNGDQIKEEFYMNAEQSLQEFLDQEEQVEHGFMVTDDQQANWALRKIKQLRNQIEDNNSLATSEIEKIEKWQTEENNKAMDSINYFQSLLGQYASRLKEEDEKFKSKKLPNGRIRFVKQQPKWNYDDQTLLAALKELNMNDFISVKESPNKREIKKHFKAIGNQVINPETGELLDGVTIEEQGEKFEVVVDE